MLMHGLIISIKWDHVHCINEIFIIFLSYNQYKNGKQVYRKNGGSFEK